MKIYMKVILMLLPLSLVASEVTVEQLFNVQTVKVSKETIGISKKNYGYAKADESRTYSVTPRFGGYVEVLYADKIYKKVKKGDPLASVYSPEIFKAKEEYLNAYQYTQQRENRTMLESAKLKLILLGVSDVEIKAITTDNTTSVNTMIYAPRDGYIFMKNIDKGSAFNAKTELFKLVNLDEIWIEMKLFEEQLRTLKNVEKYRLSFKSIEQQYTTTSAFLYPSLDPKEATATLRLQVNNREHRIFPGMYTTVHSLSQTETYLILPTTAVIRKNGTYYTFMVGEFEGEYEPIEVSVKPLNANSYIITEGLSEGDEVVNNALFMMDSDAQVNGLY